MELLDVRYRFYGHRRVGMRRTSALQRRTPQNGRRKRRDQGSLVGRNAGDCGQVQNLEPLQQENRSRLNPEHRRRDQLRPDWEAASTLRLRHLR